MSDFEQWVLNEARKATALPQPCVIGWSEQLQIARAIASKVEEETRERCALVCHEQFEIGYAACNANYKAAAANCESVIRTLPSKYGES